MNRIASICLFTVALTACGGGSGEIAPAGPAPGPAPADTVDALPEPVAAREPEPSLEERWRAPFAVQSRGRIPPREARSAVVHTEDGTAPVIARRDPASDTADEPEPEPATAPAAAAPPAPASRPAATTPPPRQPDRPARAPAGRAQSHTVAAGETFFGIARRYNVTPAALRAANPGVNENQIRSGKTLRIPSAEAVAAPAPAVRTHLVVKGDTLFGIARRYGVSPQAIREANRMESDNVKLGQTLVIPAGG